MKEKSAYFIVIFLIVASLIAFGRIAQNGFMHIDDMEYLSENQHIQSGFNQESLKWAATAVVASNWHPVTLLSHMLDWKLFGANASGHHMVSLLLHIGAVIFLFLFLHKTTNNLWPSAFAAALFALHPLRAESVAWAAERKDVLSMFFGMASLYAYAFYVENSKTSRYFLCLILFALALMSKPMMVTLPFVLLLLDYWPLDRWQNTHDQTGKGFNSAGRLILEKVPFILLTIGACMIALWAQNKGNSIVPFETLPVSDRAINAIVSYAAYLWKMFCPVNLAIFYPYQLPLPAWKVFISVLTLIFISLAAIYYIRKLPFLFVGWFWYLGTLVPVIGLVQVGEQAMADRYTYLPSIGIAIALAWTILFLMNNKNIPKKIFLTAGIFVLSILAILTWNQCGYWKNNIELWKHNLNVTGNNLIAQYNFGLAYFNEGNFEAAIDIFNPVIRKWPRFGYAYVNRGFAYSKLGKYQPAIDDLNKAVTLLPDSAKAYNFRGMTYDGSGHYQSAIEDFNKAIALKPDYIDAYNHRGVIYIKLRLYQNALNDFSEAIRLKPNYESYLNRGGVYGELGMYKPAIDNLNAAIELEPDNVPAYFNRATVYLDNGEIQRGCFDAHRVCEAGGFCQILEAARSKGYCK